MRRHRFQKGRPRDGEERVKLMPIGGKIRPALYAEVIQAIAREGLESNSEAVRIGLEWLVAFSQLRKEHPALMARVDALQEHQDLRSLLREALQGLVDAHPEVPPPSA